MRGNDLGFEDGIGELVEEAVAELGAAEDGAWEEASHTEGWDDVAGSWNGRNGWAC